MLRGKLGELREAIAQNPVDFWEYQVRIISELRQEEEEEEDNRLGISRCYEEYRGVSREGV